MKRWLPWLFLTVFSAFCCDAEVEWLTDADAALAKAKAEHKCVLLDFTGSDWCGWCMKLKNEVYDNPGFAAFARDNLVMVEVDFPRSKPISAAQKKANQILGRTYGVRGYPMTVLLNAQGEKLGERSGYVPGGPSAFIAMVKGWQGHSPTATVAAAPEPVPAPKRAPEFVPVPPATPTQYGDLALKAISGTKDRRMAMINNELFLVGETAKVKVHDGRVEVTCKEIHDDSVLILIGGKQLELRLP